MPENNKSVRLIWESEIESSDRPYIYIFISQKTAANTKRNIEKKTKNSQKKLQPLSTICHAESRPAIHIVINQNSTLFLSNANWPLSSHIVLPNAEDGRQHR